MVRGLQTMVRGLQTMKNWYPLPHTDPDILSDTDKIYIEAGHPLTLVGLLAHSGLEPQLNLQTNKICFAY